MIFDAQLNFDPPGTLITTTATSTNQIDLRSATDFGIGAGGNVGKLSLVVFIGATFAAAGAATLNVQMMGAPDNGSGAPGSYTVYVESGAISKANLIAGAKVLDVDLPRRPPGTQVFQGMGGQLLPIPRFLQLNYVVASGPFTAGAVFAALAGGSDAPIFYPRGIPPQA